MKGEKGRLKKSKNTDGMKGETDQPKIDISVSKLQGFETFANVLRVSVSENLVSERKSRFQFRKIWSRKKSLGFGFVKLGLRKKVMVSVSENLVSENSFSFGKFGLKKSQFWF